MMKKLTALVMLLVMRALLLYGTGGIWLYNYKIVFER
jgi:hypothetical protein